MFNSWIFWVTLFVIAQIVFLQTFKYVTKTSRSISALTVLIQIISAVSIMVLTPFFKWRWPSGAEWWMWILLVASFVTFAINDRLDAVTRKHLDISVDTMLHQLYRIIFLPMLILVAGSPFNWATLTGGIVIVLMNMFLILERGKFRFDRYVLLKLLSVAFFTAAMTLQLRAVSGFHLPFFVFLSFGAPAVFLLCIRQATLKSVVKEVSCKQWWVLLICGVAQAIMSLAQYMFWEMPETVKMTAISAVYVLLNVVFAYIFLKERNNLPKKIIAAVGIVACLVLIALKPF